MQPVFRFAPSPNGALHLGHACSALINARMAEASGGRFLLRIEDIDRERCLPQYEAGIFEDLAWLGLDWERPVRRQSEHFADYRQALERLVESGLVYPAFMSRGEVRAAMAEAQAGGRAWPRDPDGVPLYPDRDRLRSARERDRAMASGEPHAWRLDMAAAIRRIGRPLTWQERDEGLVEADPALWGDVVVAVAGRAAR